MIRYLLIAATLAVFATPSLGIKCYTCVGTTGIDTCAILNSTVTTTEGCDTCQIVKQAVGALYTFARTCVKSPAKCVPNDSNLAGVARTITECCTTDLCQGAADDGGSSSDGHANVYSVLCFMLGLLSYHLW